MAKDFSSAVSSQLAATRRRPVNLFILDLGGGVTLRYAAAKNDVTFPSGGYTYSAKACSYGSVKTSIEGEVGRVTVRLDNTDRDMAAYANEYNFRGRKLTVWRVFRDASGTTDYDSVVMGRMEEPTFDYNWMSVPVVSNVALDKRFPERSFGRHCGYVFGGNRCNADGNADLDGLILHRTGTASRGVRGGVTNLFDSGLTEAASFWNHGRLISFVGGVSEERNITEFESGGTVVFDVPCSTALGGSTKYDITTGCCKNWDCCSGTSAFGPTEDNSLNYGGFMHVAKKPDKDA